MGLISWIKDKYNEHRYQTALDYISTGNTSGAIEILTNILDKHIDAPGKLLEVYHSILYNADDNHVLEEVVKLYKWQNSLSDKCIAFARQISQLPNRIYFAATYSSTLYKAGIHALESIFVSCATSIVVHDANVKSLSRITDSRPLLSSLSTNLFQELKRNYADPSKIDEAYRIALLLEQYQNTSEFKTYLANTHFSYLAKRQVTASSIAEFDKLFKDVKNRYKLSSTNEKKLLDRAFNLALELKNKNDFVGALLISQRLINIEGAKPIYSTSALKIYQQDKRSSLVHSETLYKSLGSSGEQFLKNLEAYVPYANHSQKYIAEAGNILRGFGQLGDVEKAKSHLTHIWSIAKDDTYLTIPFDSPNPNYCESIISFIVDFSNNYLASTHSLNSFINKLCSLSYSELVLNSLEKLINQKQPVDDHYIEQIVRFSKSLNHKERINLINRGLSIKRFASLFNEKAIALETYISTNRYDKDFASEQSEQLIGIHEDAEIFLTIIAMGAAKSSRNLDTQFTNLKKAILFKKQHHKPFNEKKYSALAKDIQNQCEDFAQRNFQDNTAKAVELLYLLRDNGFDWYDCYGRLQLNQFDNRDDSEETLSLLYAVIEEKPQKKCAISSSLWAKAVNISKSIYSKGTHTKRIKGLEETLTQIKTKCDSPNKSDLEKTVIDALAKTYLSKGKKSEKAADLKSAKEDYSTALNLAYNVETQARFFISKIKLNEQLTAEDKKSILQIFNSNPDKKFVQDLAYRYCLLLLQAFNIEEAESINFSVLGNDSEITTLCNDYRIRQQEQTFSEINDKIEAISKQQLSAKDAVLFGQNLGKMLNNVNLLLKITKKQSDELKQFIRCYAIKKFYDEENFVEAEAGLKVQDSQYLSDPIELRNIAIMCLMAAEAKQLTDKNYREFLAIWATAVYQQDLFVKSLDYTLWDDPYTFTLDEALGQLENDDLPDNVTYDDVGDDNVVAIKEVQKALITRMEVALNDNPDYQKFFNDQIDAMDKLAEQNLDEHCVLVAPYLLLMSDKYKQSVHHALEVEANAQYGNWEDVVEIGTLYGMANGVFGNYQKAIQYNDEAIVSIRDRRQINTKFTASRINVIKQFSKLFSTLVASVSTSLTEDIANEVDYNRIISNYSSVCKLLESDNLNFSFSNYINQSIVSELNDKSLPLASGAKTLIGIYPFCQSNPHLKRNLCNIVEALIHNYITDGTTGNLDALDIILSSTRDFDNNVVSALTGGSDAPEELLLLIFVQNESQFNSLKRKIGGKSIRIRNQFDATATKIADAKVNIELSQIIDKVNNETLNKCDALEKIYNIYINHKANVRVCQNLATLVPMCIMEYIIQDKYYGQSKVKSVLDKLKNNMSPTFRANNSEIGQAYNLIWGQLDYSTRSALSGSGYGLNDKGLALKRGLDYLKALK